MRIVKVVNGIEYVFDVGRNYEIGEQIKGDKDGYSLIHQFDGFNSTIFFKSRRFFDSEQKNIGILLYDHTSDIVTYKKYGFKKEIHEFKTAEAFGLNWDIVSNLKAKDRVVIEEKADNKKILYLISVSKLLRFQNFRYFKSDGFEKQIFIPVCEFRRIETKRERSVRPKNKAHIKRKTDI